MKFNPISSRAVALLSLIAAVEAAQFDHGHGHARLHERLHQERDESATIEKRGGQCQFPSDAGLVAVTPNAKNAGWAMSPDQPCKPGNYCPYACPEGQVSMQWDPHATSYSYPVSMNGGLYCDHDGNIQKPFPDKPYCEDGTGAVSAVNKCSGHVAFCQTVLPGNEAMLIPTLVNDVATLAVPGTSYWLSTAAHYYINPPGIDTETACVWGTSSNPYGNWSPYVAGANTDHTGQTFVKIGWNPVYLEPATPFRDMVPDFGVEIVCEGDGCNGLPCKIDPSVNGVNEITGSGADGAGDGAFCVVTVPKGQKANVVVFDKSGGGSSGSSSSSAPSSSAPSSTHTSTHTSVRPTTSSSTHTSVPSTTSSSSSSTHSSSSIVTTSSIPVTTSSSVPSTSSALPTSTSALSSSSILLTSFVSTPIPSSSAKASRTYSPHVFVEPSNAGSVPTALAANSDSLSASVSDDKKSAASAVTASILSLILSAFAASVAMSL